MHPLRLVAVRIFSTTPSPGRPSNFPFVLQLVALPFGLPPYVPRVVCLLLPTFDIFAGLARSLCPAYCEERRLGLDQTAGDTHHFNKQGYCMRAAKKTAGILDLLCPAGVGLL